MKSVGYKRIYTSDGGVAQTGALILPRNSVDNTWTVETLRQVIADGSPTTPASSQLETYLKALAVAKSQSAGSLFISQFLPPSFLITSDLCS